MKKKQALKKMNKASEIMETLRLLGIEAKSFTINFNELPAHLPGRTIKNKGSRKTSLLTKRRHAINS